MDANKNRTEYLKKFIPIILISLALSFLLLIYAPIELLANNTYEFYYTVYDILRFMFPAFIVTVLLCTGIGILIRTVSDKGYDILLVTLLVTFLCTYIQGTFLAGNLPPLDGRTIDWTKYDSQRINGIILWGLVSVSGIIMLLKLKSSVIRKIISAVGGFFSMILFVTLIMLVVHSGTYKLNSVTLPDETYLLDMSEDKDNYVIFLLDAIDAEAFQIVSGEHPEYKEEFEDFTSFSNVTSGYPYTSRSIPFILSGKWYENDRPFEEYCEEAFRFSPLLSEMTNRNYRKGFYNNEFFYVNGLEELFENISSAFDFVYPDRFFKMQLLMSGYRYAPYDLKKYCVLTPENFYVDSLKDNGLKGGSFSTDDETFLKNLKETSVKYSDDSCFRYIHIRGAHEPFIYASQTESIPDNSYLSSVEFTISIAEEYLKKLKAAGVYDNSVIVLMADHGYVEDDVAFGRQNPFLMVKGINEKHPFYVSDISISHENIQNAFLKLLNGSGALEAFSYDGNTEPRRFLFYNYGKEDTMWEYYQYGHASDESTMKETGKVFSKVS